MVMGPAGAGKSTFCGALLSHLRTVKRSAYYVNLDPAADAFMYQPDLDIRDLISLEDVMEELVRRFPRVVCRTTRRGTD